MDSRHEFLIQDIFNELLTDINQFLQDNVETLVDNPNLLSTLQQITETIYACAQDDVDVYSVLSKQNLLAIHPLSLPTLPDAVYSSHADFLQCLNKLDALLEEALPHHPFYIHLTMVINKAKTALK